MHGRPKAEFRFNLEAETFYDEVAEVYVSHCITLDVFSQGETKAQADVALKGAVLLYLSTMWKRNTFDNVLNRRGFRLRGPGDDDKSPIERQEHILANRPAAASNDEGPPVAR